MLSHQEEKDMGPLTPSPCGSFYKDPFYRKRLEKSIICALLLTIFIFSFSKRKTRKALPPVEINIASIVTLDTPPPTSRKHSGSTVPQKPSIPLAAETEFIPEEMLPDTLPNANGNSNLLWNDMLEGIGLPDPGGVEDFGGDPGDRGAAYQPGFVELNILVNREGRVDSVMIIENTTRSVYMANKALQKAYRSLFILPWKRSDGETMWIQRKYWFKKE
jgi:hypothetical protein